MKKTCGLFNNIAPLYLRSLWYKLALSEKVSYVFYSSSIGFSGIKTIDINESIHVNTKGLLDWWFLKNIYIKRILIYQVGILREFLNTNYDTYIINGEMQCLSSWLAALICKIRRKPLIFWGHGLYGNERFFTRHIRIMFYRLSDFHLVYAQRAGDLMLKAGFKPDSIFTVYNSLNYDLHLKLYQQRNEADLAILKRNLFPADPSASVVIFIGRLTKQKRISLLIEAVKRCRLRGLAVNCLLIGEGEENKKLKDMASELGINDTVRFYGESYDEIINAQLIMMSDCCVSPGNVGLTAIHCMSLGTPVITHGNLTNQNPEVEAIIDKKTGLLFEEGNIESLSGAIYDMIVNYRKSLMESNCVEEIKKSWNPVNQQRIFDETVIVASEKYHGRKLKK